MIKNYLKIAVRALLKQKTQACINILGLGLGMACCFLLYLFVQHEWSYDQFHQNGDEIYSLYIQERTPDGSLKYRRLIPLGVPEALAKQMPGVKSFVQLASGDATVLFEGQPFRETIFEVDASFFEVFSYPLLAGDTKSVLSDPQSVVLSEKLVRKYFGEVRGGYDHALGKTFTLSLRGELQDFSVSGVMQDFPENSSLQVDFAISFKNYPSLPLGSNDVDGRTSTYLLLEPGIDPSVLEKALSKFTQLHFKDRIALQTAQGQIADEEDALQLRLQPIREMHLNPKIPIGYGEPTHDPKFSFTLIAIGLIVLLIACGNFTTLSVARASQRAREVGLRKVVGAQKKQLAAQFVGEAFLATLLASLLGLGLSAAVLPAFNELSGRSLSLAGLGNVGALAVLLALVLGVSLLSGGYPAFVLSAFQPVSVLKSSLTTGKSNSFVRVLVGLQFVLAISLMICTSIMMQQVEFLKGKDLGFNEDMVVVFRAREDGSAAVIERYRNAIVGFSKVKFVVGAGQAFSRSEDVRLWQDSSGNTRRAHVYGVDYDYVDMFEMEMALGRNFSPTFSADATTGVLVNETLVKDFNLKDPVGKSLQGFMPALFAEPPVIIGVVKDFNFKSLHQQIEPAILTMHPNYWARFRNVYVKIEPVDLHETLTVLRDQWHEVAPNTPFDYFFLDQDIQKQYLVEERWIQIIRLSTVLALSISCLGLFALSAMMMGKRTKEIGIRKVLGASVATVLLMISRDFSKLLLFALLLATPLGYFAMQEWLQSFAYRTEIGLSTFLGVTFLAFSSILLTASYHAVRAAVTNPAKTLRYE